MSSMSWIVQKRHRFTNESHECCLRRTSREHLFPSHAQLLFVLALLASQSLLSFEHSNV